MPAEPSITHSVNSRRTAMSHGISRRTLACGDRMLLAEITLQRGSVVPDHLHPHEQIGYVSRGRLEFNIGEISAILEAGDGYTIPADVRHSVVALEDSIAVDVFSPVREEYR